MRAKNFFLAALLAPITVLHAQPSLKVIDVSDTSVTFGIFGASGVEKKFQIFINPPGGAPPREPHSSGWFMQQDCTWTATRLSDQPAVELVPGTCLTAVLWFEIQSSEGYSEIREARLSVSTRIPAPRPLNFTEITSQSVRVNFGYFRGGDWCDRAPQYQVEEVASGHSSGWMEFRRYATFSGDSVWGSWEVSGLEPGKEYTFRVKGRNADSLETAWTQLGEVRTLSTSPVDGVQVPEEFFLGQNYPNPFNPETTISFTLPSPGEVELRIFDLQGKQVVTLIAGSRMSAGSHKVTWDAKGEAAGLYIARLNFKGCVKATKMILTR